MHILLFQFRGCLHVSLLEKMFACTQSVGTLVPSMPHARQVLDRCPSAQDQAARLPTETYSFGNPPDIFSVMRIYLLRGGYLVNKRGWSRRKLELKRCFRQRTEISNRYLLSTANTRTGEAHLRPECSCPLLQASCGLSACLYLPISFILASLHDELVPGCMTFLGSCSSSRYEALGGHLF